jgi:hypothetical protein
MLLGMALFRGGFFAGEWPGVDYGGWLVSDWSPAVCPPWPRSVSPGPAIFRQS